MTRIHGPKPYAILVVEDDEMVRSSFCEVLALDGSEVFSAENGKRALEMLDDLPRPAVIVLDLMMPVMSGPEFLAELRRGRHKDIPVAVVSAYADQTTDLPAEAILSKPIRPTLLLETLTRLAQKGAA